MTEQQGAAVQGVDHVSLLVSDSERASAFYQAVLNLEVLPRPDLGFPGAWLILGAGQTLHLLEVSSEHVDADKLPQHGGRDFHFALKVNDLSLFVEKLDEMQIDYNKSKSGRQALFFRDPDGNAIELTQV